jgi:gliding motility-associated lipoprotein GldD
MKNLKMSFFPKIISAIVLSATLSACGNDPVPRPTGYFRIDLPEKKYEQKDSIPFPFSFDLPQYAYINLQRTQRDPNLFNIDFPRFQARIHMSYFPIDTNVNELIEEARSLVYKHVVKAQDIQENMIVNPESGVYGTYYHIEGNAASGSQFFLTDSSNHFVRGALYFSVEPNYDSIAPVQQFIKADIERMIESFKWTEE